MRSVLQFWWKRAAIVLGAGLMSVVAIGSASADVFNLPSGETSIKMLPVGNAGNAADSTGFGAVSYNYNIDAYDVTNAQYVAFLNAVASTDPYGLYNGNMVPGSGLPTSGISRSGDSGHYTYSLTGNANYPITAVTWGDAARFANWLTNGQPTGAEGNGTTETGSYTLNGVVTEAALNAVTRNANADYSIPTENEWYKAAYFNPASSSYYLYPTSSNSQPSNVLSATGTNNANYYNGDYTDLTNLLTAVGAFADTTSPYGLYDAGGDVEQWNESLYSGSSRGLRGGTFAGYFYSYGDGMQSIYTTTGYPTAEFNYNGFRVSQVPEAASMGFLAFAGIGMLARRRGVKG